MSCLFCGLILPHGRLRTGPCGDTYCSGVCQSHHKALLTSAKASGTDIRESEFGLVTDGTNGLALIQRLAQHLAAPPRAGDPPNEAAVKKQVADQLSAVLALLKIGEGGFEQAESVLKLAADTLRSVAKSYEASPDAYVRSKAEFPKRLAASLDTLLEIRKPEKRNIQTAEDPNKRARPPPPAAAAPPQAPVVMAEPDIADIPAGVLPQQVLSPDQRAVAELEGLASRPEPINAKLASIEKKRQAAGDSLDQLVASMPNSIYINLLEAVRSIAVAAVSSIDNVEDKIGKGGKVDKNLKKAGKALSALLVELCDTYGAQLGPELWAQITNTLEFNAPVVNGRAQARTSGKIAIAGPNRQSLDPLESNPEENVREIVVYYLPLAMQIVQVYYGSLSADQWARLANYVRNRPRSERSPAWLENIYKGIVPDARGWIAPALNRLRRIRGGSVVINQSMEAGWKAVLLSLRSQQPLYW